MMCFLFRAFLSPVFAIQPQTQYFHADEFRKRTIGINRAISVTPINGSGVHVKTIEIAFGGTAPIGS